MNGRGLSRLSRRGLLLTGLAASTFVVLAQASRIAWAQNGPDPVAIMSAFYDTLLDIMKRGPELGYEGRYQVVEPVLHQTFDLATMCKIAVGPEWTPMSGEEKTVLLRVFSAYMVSTYAARFHEFSGQQFKIGEAKQVGDDRVLVATQIIKENGEPVDLKYLFRLHAGAWRVIDIYLSGTISEMARMRSDFTQSLQKGGASGLVADLEKKITELRAEN